MLRNIVILHFARSRSSLVSAIVHAHGWNGPENVNRSKKYPLGTFGNKPLNEHFRAVMGGRLYPLQLQHAVPDLSHVDPAPFLPPEPWLAKVDPPTWRAFWRMNPRPVFISVYRDPEDNLRSIMEKDHRFTESQARKLIGINHREMDLAPGFDVDTDELIRGEWLELRTAIEYAGRTFDPEIARACIQC